MSTLRFTLVVAGLFALTFVGVSWGNMGFPIMTVGVAPLKPDARIPTFDEAVKKGLREDWVNSKTNQSDGNEERDKLRLDLLQASTAYKMSPCDDTMKKNLVAALSSYVKAWSDMAFCKPGVGGCPSSSDERLDTAAATFKTPADANMRKALREAIGQGGISREDFPSAIRRHVFMISGSSPPDEPEAACLVARKAASRQ
jgi:hypothetical protein